MKDFETHWFTPEGRPADPDVIVEKIEQPFSYDIERNYFAYCRAEVECNKKLHDLKAQYVSHEADLLYRREKQSLIEDWSFQSVRYITENLIEFTRFCHNYNLDAKEILYLLSKKNKCELCDGGKCTFKCGKWPRD